MWAGVQLEIQTRGVSSMDALFKNSELDEGLKGTHMKTEQKRFHHEVDRVLVCLEILDLRKDQQR